MHSTALRFTVDQYDTINTIQVIRCRRGETAVGRGHTMETEEPMVTKALVKPELFVII